MAVGGFGGVGLAFGIVSGVCLTSFQTLSADVPAHRETDAVGRFAAMIQRPLFSPTRRPPLPPPAAINIIAPDPGPAPVVAPDLMLSGVIVGPSTATAIVRRHQDAAPIRLALGSQIDGWTVSAVRPRAIVLSREARDITIEMSASTR